MKKILIMLILITTILLCPFSVLQADAAYQISISSNTEFAVFTLSYTGSVTGLQITSPGGVSYNQSSAGAAYKTIAGKIQIGVRFAEAGKWKILLSGSPDNGFQIMVTTDASFGDFAGSVPSVTPTYQPTPTLQPTSTSSPTQVLTPTPESSPKPIAIPAATKEPTSSSPLSSPLQNSPTKIPTPIPTKDIFAIPTQIPAAGSVSIVPTNGAVTNIPTNTPDPTVSKVDETEALLTPTTKTKIRSLEEENGSNLSFLASKDFRKICLCALVALLLIGTVLVITKRRNQIRAGFYQLGIRCSEKNEKKRVRLQQQAEESSRLRALRQIETEEAQLHAQKTKEKAAAKADLIKKMKNDQAEIDRLHVMQVKATADALRIQRRQEQLKEKTRVKEKRSVDVEAKRLIRKQEKEKAAAASILQHTMCVAKNRDHRIRKRHAFIKRLEGLRKKTPVLQSQQELQLRRLFESQLEKERVVLAEMDLEAKARAAATKESRGKQ